MFLIFFFLSVSFYFNVITAQFQKEKKKKKVLVSQYLMSHCCDVQVFCIAPWYL